jgi:hypothetical protein
VEKQVTGGWSNALTSSFAENLGKGKSQTLQLLTEAYGDDAIKNLTVFEWHDRCRGVGKT